MSNPSQVNPANSETFTGQKRIGVGSFLLTVMLVVIVFLCATILLVTFHDTVQTNRSVLATLNQAAQAGSGTTVLCGTNTPAATNTWDERLRAGARGALDSNTISFLFQVFSIALVSAGVYLLERSHRNVASAERSSKKAEGLIQSAGSMLAELDKKREAVQFSYKELDGLLEIGRKTMGELQKMATGSAQAQEQQEEQFRGQVRAWGVFARLISAHSCITMFRSVPERTTNIEFWFPQMRESLKQALVAVDDQIKEGARLSEQNKNIFLDIARTIVDYLLKMKLENRPVDDLLVIATQLVRSIRSLSALEFRE